jgi:SAM-dependent methyltransferase
MEKSLPLKNILQISHVYRYFTELIGGMKVRKFWIEKYVRPWEGARLLDIGCGPADILEFLPNVQYVGFDMNPRYISAAQKRWGFRGTFVHQSVESISSMDTFVNFDLVTAFGVLHHLDDQQALGLISLAYRVLKSGGKFITLDGCFRDSISTMARFLLKHDRGRFIRRESEYLELVYKKFDCLKVSYDIGPLRVPYSAVVLECEKH